MSARVVGLDLSLTGTGIAIHGDATMTCTFRTRGVERLINLRDAVMRVCAKENTLVVVEGYSMGGQRGSAGVGQMLGELGGVVRVALHEAGVPYVEVPPATLKKFATGKGNAGKPDMLAAAIRAGYEGPNDDNAVDAKWLMWAGRYALGHNDVPQTAYRDDAIAKVEWPIGRERDRDRQCPQCAHLRHTGESCSACDCTSPLQFEVNS